MDRKQTTFGIEKRDKKRQPKVRRYSYGQVQKEIKRIELQFDRKNDRPFPLIGFIERFYDCSG
jgi:hypothetical protein